MLVIDFLDIVVLQHQNDFAPPIDLFYSVIGDRRSTTQQLLGNPLFHS